MLGWLATAGAAIGLTAGYGSLAAMFGRFLFPARPAARGWMFVSRLAALQVGDALLFRTPSGATVNVARQGADDRAEAFIALSSTCPHLGCQVHWEPQNDRFFCPCHNGVFTPDGVGIGGPPGDAGQSLPRYPLKVDAGLLYIEVPQGEIALGEGHILDAPAGTCGPGQGARVAASVSSLPVLRPSCRRGGLRGA